MIEQDKTQQLIELAKLRESGVVTEAEFLSLKKEIIESKSSSNEEDSFSTPGTHSGSPKTPSLEIPQTDGSGQSKMDDVVQGCLKYWILGAIVIGVIFGIYVYIESSSQSEFGEVTSTESLETNPSEADSKEWQELLDLLSYDGFDKAQSSPIFINGQQYDGITKAGIVFNGKSKSFNKQYSHFTSYDSWLLFRDNPVSWMTETGRVSDISIYFDASEHRTDDTPIVRASWKSDDNMNTAVMEIFPLTIGKNARQAVYYTLYTSKWSVWSYRQVNPKEFMDIMNAFEKVLSRKFSFLDADKTNSLGEFSLESGNQMSLKSNNRCVDGAGREYRTIQIGKQLWMAENLAYKPSNGKFWAYDDNLTNVEIYGYLYDWQSACMVCPEGWHLPSGEEWGMLHNFLSGNDEQHVGSKLKSKGTQYWRAPNSDATNESGFSALPGGRYNNGHGFYALGYHGHWWSSTDDGEDYTAYTIFLLNDGSVLEDHEDYKVDGLSVRCVRNKSY